MLRYGNSRAGFSLIELIIVMMILGVVAAIAVPRMSRAGEGSNVRGMTADLAVLRSAIERYRAEHGGYPPVPNFVTHLTTKTGSLGPYIVAIPALKTGAKKGQTAVVKAVAVPPVAEITAAGWLYDPDSGSIWANDADHFDK